MNLVTRTALVVGGVSAVMLGLLGAAGYVLVREHTIETERARVDRVASEAAQSVRSRLQQANALAQAIADNPVVRNALIDDAGRETYIRPILEGVSRIDGQAVAWALVDYTGAPIIETGAIRELPRRRAWLRDVIANGTPGAIEQQAEGALDHVTIAHPVLLPNSRTHEGAVWVQLPAQALVAGLATEGRSFRLDGGGIDADTAPLALGRVSVPLMLAPPVGALGLRLQGEISEDQAQRALARLRWQMVLAVVLASAAVVALSMWSATRLTRPIRSLVAAVHAVAEGRLEMAISADAAASDEVVNLAQSFQQMVDRLRAAARTEQLEAQAQFRAIFDSSRIGMRLRLNDGTHVHANQALLDMIGYTNEELARQDPLALTVPEQRESMREVLSEMASGRLSDHREEKRLLCKSGATLWVSMVMTPLRDSQGQVTGIAAQYENIAERRAQAEALARSEARYRTLIEWMPLPMWVIRDDKYVYANAAAMRALGVRSPTELIGSDEFSRIEPLYHDIARAHGKTSANHAVADMPPVDLRLLRMDGTPIDVEGHSIGFDWGNTAARVVIWRDVTTERAQARALAESEQRFRALIEWTPEAVMVVRNSVLLYLNPAAAELFGADDAAQLIGSSVMDRVHPDYRDLARVRIRNLAQGGVSRQPKVDLQFLRLDDTAIDAEVQSTRIMFDGAPAAHIAWHDVTERKRDREALQHSEANLRQAQQVAHLGNFELDLSRQSVRWSDEVYRIFGVEPGAPVSLERYRSLVPPDAFERVMQLVARTVQSGEPYEIEHPIVLADGSCKHVYALGRAVYDEQGRVHGIFGVVQDITARKQAELRQQSEEERLRFHDRLHEATRDLVDAQEILRTVTTMLGGHLGVSRCGWAQVDVVARKFTVESAQEAPGLPMSIVGTHPFDAWGPRMWSELEQGRIVVLRDVARELTPDPALAAWLGAGVAAFVGCPIHSQGRLHALLAIDSAQPRDWTEAEIRLVEQVAQRVSATVQRALAEAALRRSESSLREAQRVAAVGSFDFDVHTQAVEWSEEMCRIYGIEPAGAVTLETYRSALTPAGFERSMQDVRRAAESGEPYVHEQHITLPDGSQKHLHVIGRPLRGADGQVQRIFGTVQDVTARLHAEARLRAALHEKEILLKEIYHRVKNNLQVVSSLLMLQSQQPNADQVGALLAESSNRVQSMALVHEQLYQQSDLSSIDFARYLEQLVSHLSDAYADVTRRVRVRLDVQPVALGIETAVPLGLIINELLSNAFKHAYPAGRGGEVRVRLTATAAGRIELEVSDDGVGVPAGLQLDAVSSLGMRLVTSLAQQLDATFDSSARGTSGARFTLQFVPELAEPMRLLA